MSGQVSERVSETACHYYDGVRRAGLLVCIYNNNNNNNNNKNNNNNNK